LSIIMMDVDHFKSINDTHGHAAGDATLRALAEIIETTRRREDIACRYGGEEFAIICRGIHSWQACVLAERLRTKIALQIIPTSDRALRITCSFGVAGGTGSDQIIAKADHALYRAKHGGRNCVVEFTQDPADSVDNQNAFGSA